MSTPVAHRVAWTQTRRHCHPNVVFLLTDQWRLHALGYAGNAQVKTPNIDRLASESVNFKHAISGYSVCCPWRASFLTGQYPLTHGVIVNDVPISSEPVGLGEAFKSAGYNTAYIGKWHVDGRGRSAYIPPERRLGFEHFKALECTHDYNQSAYYDNDDPTMRAWDGYDVFAQTADAQRYIESRKSQGLRATSAEKPFMLVLSWGPPHNPYETAPKEYRDMYNPRHIELRPNVPPEMADDAREWLAGYYAHCSAIDKSVGDIMKTLDDNGLSDNTVLVFASDHGDMLGSHGWTRKQKPWEESIRVPFLLRYPAKFGPAAREVSPFLNAHDIMPTLLGICGLPIPSSVDGRDFSAALAGKTVESDGALLACFHPFGEWNRIVGGHEYRGIRTPRYTYCRSLSRVGSRGHRPADTATSAVPWLLYDNEVDPYQLENLVDDPAYSEILARLEALLQRELDAIGDEFLDGMSYINRWGYPLDDTGTVPFR
ncbi:MAG: sulfatase-like hydrolase/transferase [Chloroflexota bacterium]|nr:sulfatase-like hydrolase/transferase [Chloroflexota bacterium]MDE2910468.1 sulfatase-like hydrolase/transferase [Chloroflexota bacterium]